MPLPEDLPPHERPRERLLRHGPASLRDAELLALALRTGTRGRTAIDMGRQLLHPHGGLPGLFPASPTELMSQPGPGAATVSPLTAHLALAPRPPARQHNPPPPLSEP